jgi:hypothetical protein
LSRVTILRASSKGQAFDCSAIRRKEAVVSLTDILISGARTLEMPHACVKYGVQNGLIGK